MHRILIVDGDPDLADITEIHLRQSGYTTDKAYALADVIPLLEGNTYHLILIDVVLPDGAGETLCRLIRERCRCPIIFLSCLEDGDSILSAFGAGANDYLVKPVHFEELLARIEQSLREALVYEDRETPHWNDKIIRLKKLLVDTQRRRVLVEGAQVELSQIEFSILQYMASRRDTLLLYEDLYRQVWSADCLGDVRTVMVHISNLRKKIDPGHSGMIQTVRGAGYIFSDV